MSSVFAKAVAYQSSAMETGNHYKNGVSLKKQMNRQNRLSGVALIFALLFLCNVAQAQVGIAKTAKETLRAGEKYELKISSTEASDYKIVTPKDGNLTLSLESYAKITCFALYNEDGKSFAPTKQEFVSGREEGNPLNMLYIDNGKYNIFNTNNVQGCFWNETVEKFKGSFTFKLDGGTYYLRIIRGQTGLSTVNLSIQFKDLNGNVVN